MDKIDFVVTWVNGNDVNWKEKKVKYSGNEIKGMNTDAAFRDWGTFKYWFRGVEKYAPWVNKIYLITDNQIPSWLDVDNPKIRVVNHKDYLPKDALPLFNSNAIQSSIHKIPDLSEKFVYFNDDMYLMSLTKREDFFKNGLPRDEAVFTPIVAKENGTAHFQVNNMEIINKYYSKKTIIKNSKLFSLKYGLNNIRTLFQIPTKYTPGFLETHLPESFLKSTFEKVWVLESESLEKTTYSRFRALSDTNDWLFRDWQLASGDYVPRNNSKFGKLVSLSNNNDKLWDLILNGRFKVLCINDLPEIDNFDSVKQEFINKFEEKFPKKSFFEI